MTAVTLNPADAAELAQLLQFLADWLNQDLDRLSAWLEDFAGHPAYNTRQLREDLERFTFCSAAATGNPCSAHRSNRLRASAASRPAEDTPGLHGVNVVRPRAARCGRSTLTPFAAPALSGSYPGKPPGSSGLSRHRVSRLQGWAA
jgi:hypothetical protein